MRVDPEPSDDVVGVSTRVDAPGTRNSGPVLALAAALTVVAATAVVAWRGVVVTAGGRDQTLFHLPTIQKFRAEFPQLNVVDVATATGPLFHIVIAAIAAAFGLGVAATQIAGSLFAGAAAATATSVAGERTVGDRLLIVAPLLLSAYFWQSALWLNTDDAALLFTLVALALLARRQPDAMSFALIGAAAAAAVATRQTNAWVLVPIGLTALVFGADLRGRLVAGFAGCLPATLVLAYLVHAWGGFTPPAFAELNGIAGSGAALSYGLALAGFFGLPILLATGGVPARRHLGLGAVVGVLGAIPAVVFPSWTTADETRRGGWLWTAVDRFPAIADRSPLLIAGAVFGGIVATLVLARIERRLALIVASSYLAAAVVFTFGSRLYQRYFELPLAALALLTLAWLFANGAIVRRWPLLGLAAAQAVLLAGIVGYPVLTG
mgnify:CR=1 FL=1